MSSAQKFKDLLKEKSEKVGNPLIVEKWALDIEVLYKTIREWLHEEDFKSYVDLKSFDDPTIGTYESAILTIKAGDSEATVEPKYTMSSGGQGVTIASGEGSGLRVEKLTRAEAENENETKWLAGALLFSKGKVLTKERLFDLLVIVFRLEE